MVVDNDELVDDDGARPQLFNVLLFDAGEFGNDGRGKLLYWMSTWRRYDDGGVWKQFEIENKFSLNMQ